MTYDMFVIPVIKEIGLCLWHCGSKRAVLIRDLKKDLKSLGDTMKELMEIYEDVQQRVQTEELKQLLLARPTKEVASWFDKVLTLEKDVSETLGDGEKQEQSQCLAGCCPKNCWQSYKLRKRVKNMLDEVEKLVHKGRSFNIVAAEMHNAVYKKPMVETVGLDPMLQKVLGCIEDKSLRVIGLYGIGGVGKTTLLERINNLFLSRSHDFVEVILVSVSKNPDKKKIQKTILQKLGLSSLGSTEENATLICRRLDAIKFLLLLDDVWEWLDLSLLGIPLPNDQNESKVIFTTRSVEVCGDMEAQQNIKVECLTQEEALCLFRMKVGENTFNSHPRIPKLAEVMAAECKGLPLALVTVGRAMATKTKPEYWEYGIANLRNAPSEFQGMDSVLLPLRFSFDELRNATLRSCFLYCCLFPDGHNIRIEELIEYWRAERLISGRVGDGEYIIGSLKCACLLESGESEEFVRMHGLIRDMAWRECSDEVAIFIKRDAKSNEERGLVRWNLVERLSLWDYNIDDVLLNSSPTCIEQFCENDKQLLNLRTMICKVPMLTTFPAGFFPLMSALTLLDLSNSFLLRVLPQEIGKLIKLEYLNVSETAITELPDGIQNLVKLRCLILNGTAIQEIQRGLISRLQFLEIFSWVGQPIRDCNSHLLEELDGLPRLSEICIGITLVDSFQMLMGSHKLQRCIRKLFYGIDRLPILEVSPILLSRMEHLELCGCINLEEVRISFVTFLPRHEFSLLRKVVILDCDSLSDVRWLIYAPNLQTLELRDCTNLVGCLALREETDIEKMHIFSSLMVLRLVRLPFLETICEYVLPFPLLRKIEVRDCHSLRELPFDSKSAKNCLIHADSMWWNILHWKDEAVKQVFSSKLVRHSRGHDDDRPSSSAMASYSAI